MQMSPNSKELVKVVLYNEVVQLIHAMQHLPDGK